MCHRVGRNPPGGKRPGYRAMGGPREPSTGPFGSQRAIGGVQFARSRAGCNALTGLLRRVASV